MTLWTPYMQEVPLDLTKKKPIKTEPLPQSPEPSKYSQQSYCAFGTQPHYGYTLYHHPDFCVPAVTSPSTSNSTNGQLPIPARITSFAPSPPTSPEFEDLSLDEEYAAFEREQLCAIAGRNGGSLVGNNPRMRRAVHGKQKADDTYRSHREKNNYAAKQSRDRRKMREISLSIKVAYLTKKLTELKASLGLCVECRQRANIYRLPCA